jgi:transcriptional regulator with XRE-family HTH domain
MPKTSDFAAALKRERGRQKLSVARLAQLAGLHRTAVWKLEAGLREPTLATARALAKALGVPAGRLG